jgi:cytochrome o ubiquinol oxidase operon protein cyoD
MLFGFLFLHLSICWEYSNLKNNTNSIEAGQDSHPHGSYHSYIAGFLLCIGLTLLSFFLTFENLLAGWPLILVIAALALIQAAVQLHFFLHLGDEAKPQWNLFSFLFMLVIAFILVAGSLWIMFNLMVRTMPM